MKMEKSTCSGQKKMPSASIVTHNKEQTLPRHPYNERLPKANKNPPINHALVEYPLEGYRFTYPSSLSEPEFYACIEGLLKTHNHLKESHPLVVLYTCKNMPSTFKTRRMQ